MSRLYYAGIGSRLTPPEVLEQMETIAYAMGMCGYTLRTGGASGADAAFLRGAKLREYPTELWVPWKGYTKNSLGVKELIQDNIEDYFDMVSEYHPAWFRCSNGARKLHTRNMNILLGDLKEEPKPVRVVICWTPGGAVVGGTGLALRYAEKNGIPIVNLAEPLAYENLMKMLEKYTNGTNQSIE